MKPRNSIEGIPNMFGINYGIEPFSYVLYLPQHRFQINRLFRGNGEDAMYNNDIE